MKQNTQIIHINDIVIKELGQQYSDEHITKIMNWLIKWPEHGCITINSSNELVDDFDYYLAYKQLGWINIPYVLKRS